MRLKVWACLLTGLLVVSSLFAAEQTMKFYQGAWIDSNYKDPLSKVVITHPHKDWLINVYEHCQENNDCLVASVRVQSDYHNGEMHHIIAFWHKKFPDVKHVILMYELVLTPQDSQHLGWNIQVRDDNNLSHLVTSLHGVLNREPTQVVTNQKPPIQASEKSTKRNSQGCRELLVSCVLAKDPTKVIGQFTRAQRKVTSTNISRCLPWQMEVYDAKNIKLFFETNNMSCAQQYSEKCSQHRCVAIIKNFNDLGKPI